MKAPPNYLFAIPLIIISTLLAISSSTWIIMWMFLEINMFSFLPMFTAASSVESGEAMVKYFLMQTLGSSMMLFTACMSMSTNWNILKTMFMLGVILKMGAAPAHQWMFSIIKPLSMMTFLFLLTWQKVAPLLIMFHHTTNPSILLMLSTMSAITGALGALSQTLLRPLLVYSSINHMGWMMLSMTHSLSLLMTYMVTYFIMFISVIISVMPYIPGGEWGNFPTLMYTPEVSLIISMNILSLAGMPPLLGFAIKWAVIWVSTPYLMFTMIILLTSAIGLLYYLSLVLIFFSHPQKTFFSYSSKTISFQLILHFATPLLILMLM